MCRDLRLNSQEDYSNLDRLVFHSQDEPELYGYLYPFRCDWQGQKHRQMLTRQEARELFRAARRKRAAYKC
jgi:hypothetical protein